MDYITQMPFQEQIVEGLELIKRAVNAEALDADYYSWLLDNIPLEGLTILERKEISDRLLFIREDKLSHGEILSKIYRDFTGEELEVTQREFVPPKSFEEGIKTGIFEQINLVRLYREIMSKFPGSYYRDMLTEIITDELVINDLFNYIYTTVRTADTK